MLRRLSLASFAVGCLGVVMLAVPLVVHGQAAQITALATYNGSASGWAIQPYVENDQYINVPVGDQYAPYVFTAIDSSPSAAAKAAYITPGTAINAVLGTNGAPVSVPDGVDARYPGNGNTSSQVGAFNDSVATQAAAGSESAQAQEDFAQADAAIAAYQFAPPVFVPLPTGGGGVPTVPPVPTVPGAPTPPVGGGGGTPTPSPTPGGSGPTPTPCLVPPLCIPSQQAMRAVSPSPPVKLPDPVEQQLAAALQAFKLANPQLASISGGPTVTPNPNLPYAQADVAGQSIAQASDSGVQIAVGTHAGKIELFQGIITFAAVDTSLSASVPAVAAPGQGSISTRISGMTIAGIPVTLDQNGVTIASQSGLGGSQIQTLSAALNQVLKASGIQIGLIQAVSTAGTQSWQGSGGGVQVIATFNSPSASAPVQTTHIRFTIGVATGSASATPNQQSLSCPDCGFGFFGGFFGFPGVPGSPGSPSSQGQGIFGLPSRLSPGEMLALLFIVQGFSTAAVAGAASQADTLARLSLRPPEEETI